jgi:Arc/MetJ family transcription regulator
VKSAAISVNADHGAHSHKVYESVKHRRQTIPRAWLFLRISPTLPTPLGASNGAIIHAQSEDPMRTTVTLDDELLAKAMKLTRGLDRSTVLREGLKALIERESALRLAKLGGTQPQLEPVPRRRSAAAT